MNEHLQRLAQTEIAKHTEEAQRLHDAADRLTTAAEWNLHSAENWRTYLADIACRDIPEPRTELTLIKGEL